MENNSKPPIWFWIVSGVFLLWNLAGVGSFVEHIMITEEDIQAMSEAEQAIYRSFPLWATMAFAVAVIGSSLGCVLLLLRKSLAKPVFVISLVGIIVQMFYNLFIANSIEVYGPFAAAMALMIPMVGAFLIWFSGHGIKKGWLS